MAILEVGFGMGFFTLPMSRIVGPTGKIVASDTPDKLRARLQGGREIVAEIRGPKDVIVPQLYKLAGVTRVETEPLGDWTSYRLACGTADVRPEVFAAAAQCGWTLRELRQEKQSLEDIFVALTRTEQEAT